MMAEDFETGPLSDNQRTALARLRRLHQGWRLLVLVIVAYLFGGLLTGPGLRFHESLIVLIAVMIAYAMYVGSRRCPRCQHPFFANFDVGKFPLLHPSCNFCGLELNPDRRSGSQTRIAKGEQL